MRMMSVDRTINCEYNRCYTPRIQTVINATIATFLRLATPRRYPDDYAAMQPPACYSWSLRLQASSRPRSTITDAIAAVMNTPVLAFGFMASWT